MRKPTRCSMHFCWVSIGEVLEIPHKMAIFLHVESDGKKSKNPSNKNGPKITRFKAIAGVWKGSKLGITTVYL